MRDIARGRRRPDADGLVMGIDPMEITVEPSRTFAEPVQLVDEVRDAPDRPGAEYVFVASVGSAD